MLGRWDRALASADAFIAECEVRSPHTLESAVREVRAALLLARGDSERALLDQQRALELAAVQDDPFQHLSSLAMAAVTYAELGRLDDAYPLAAQVPPLVRQVGMHGSLTRLGLFADELGIGNELREAAATHTGPRVSAWTQPGGFIERILAGELDVAADMFRTAGNPTIEANIRKHAGFRMLAAGRAADARAELEQALAFYRTVDASLYIAQIEAALGELQSESA
jgi:tetratricopeptide (TPR) repeat protein